MDRPTRLICASEALVEGEGIRFQAMRHGEAVQAFAVRYGGIAYGYVNRCSHALTELDWIPGRFFDDSGLYLICATHGATFAPDTGRCVYGPCRGRGLTPLPLVERDGAIYLAQD